mmetsp:Transcript_110883/g.312586  ORF Transcript_110883/g.312586 Transcript_110883/m.312586 type:complete len:95 (+) Transcript_110883:1-285(+)
MGNDPATATRDTMLTGLRRFIDDRGKDFTRELSIVQSAADDGIVSIKEHISRCDGRLESLERKIGDLHFAMQGMLSVVNPEASKALPRATAKAQ